MTSDIIQQFIDSKGSLSPSSLKSYLSTLNRFILFCNERNTNIIAAAEKDISDFIKPHEFKQTQETYKKTLSSFYRWAIKNEFTMKNPTEDIITRGTKKQHKLMSYQSFRNILSKCGGLRETTIVSFMWYTGVRTRELVNIRLKDIDLINDMFFVGFSKSSNGIREIPLHIDLKYLLNKYIKKSKEIRKETNIDNNLLFLNLHGKGLKERSLQNLIAKLQNESEKFTAHDFRRAFCTNVFNESRDIVLAQELMGHVSVETTRKYIITNGKDRHKKFKALKLKG